MDTRYWGPEGWQLFHTICYNYPIKPDIITIQTHKIFFKIIGDILPCKYCRMSYKKYIEDLPVEKSLDSRDSLFKWSYLLHNKVNGKLRKQGHLNTPDPEYDDVYKFYSEEPFKEMCLLGNNFLKAIVYNYPKNGDNPRLRLIYYTFFNYLIDLYPNLNKNELSQYNNNYPILNNMENRDALKKWFYILSCNIEKNCREILPYNIYCKKCEQYRSKDCSKDTHKGNTCRKKTNKIKMTK
jgi:hypothetical protein